LPWRTPARREKLNGSAMAVSVERLRALKLLAGSPDGCSISIMLAHGLKPELLAALVQGGLATTKPETVRTGGKPIEVVRMTITDAGRRALAG
jgi:hypothetical protein